MKEKIHENLTHSGLIRVLKSFSKKEIKEFGKFISSPFYNTQSTLIRLFDELKKHYPGFASADFSKGRLYKVVNPGKHYNDVLFRKYISDLMKLAEEYLIVTDLNLYKDRKKMFLLNQYERRNLFGLFEKVIRNEYKKNQFPVNNETFYYRHFREELISNFNIRTNNLHMLKPSLLQSHKYLLLHLLLTTSVNSVMMLVNRRSFKDSADKRFFEEFFENFNIIKYLESMKFTGSFERNYISLCKCEFALLKNPYDKYLLMEMKKFILGLTGFLDKNLLYIYFSHLNIFLLINISEGKTEYNEELFDNYKLMIENELYFFENKQYINFSEYRTILLHALKLKEFAWTENFIENFKLYHADEMKDNIYKYSMAVLRFEEGRFDDSMNFLSKVNPNDIMLKLDCEVYMMMIFYEKGFYQSAESLSESYRHFIQKNEILSEDVKKLQIEFIKYFKLLLKFKINEKDDYDYKKILTEIKSVKNLRRKRWFLEKINSSIEIKNKNYGSFTKNIKQ